MKNNRAWIVVAIAIVLMLAGLVATGRWMVRTTSRAASAAINRVIEPREKQIDLGALVMRVRELSRLETASMRVMHVSTIRQSRGMIPDTFAGDEMTFLAVGDVVAGIDLSRLTRDDVRIDADGTLVLRLPASELLISRLDNDQSRVMTRETGFLRRSDPQLEGRVRAHAERSIRKEALDKGILRIADTNAQSKLGEFLITLGFEKVRFEQSRPGFRG
jgi:hypothetical protein